MKKTCVPDKNVLIQSPHALYCFEDNAVGLPLTAVEEPPGDKSGNGILMACKGMQDNAREDSLIILVTK